MGRHYRYFYTKHGLGHNPRRKAVTRLSAPIRLVSACVRVSRARVSREMWFSDRSSPTLGPECLSHSVLGNTEAKRVLLQKLLPSVLSREGPKGLSCCPAGGRATGTQHWFQRHDSHLPVWTGVSMEVSSCIPAPYHSAPCCLQIPLQPLPYRPPYCSYVKY